MPRPASAAAVVAVFAAIALVGSQACAVNLLDSGGFESYSAGDLAGQPGGPGSWREASFVTGNESTAVVQSTVGHPFPGTGTNSVEVNRAAGDDAYWAVTFSSYPLVNTDLIVIEWDMLIEPIVFPEAFGPFFGVQAYDGASTPQVLGTFGVDAATGDLMYQESGTGFMTETGFGLTSQTVGDWHQYRLVLDYSTNSYQIVFDGSLLLSESFVDGPASGFTDADIATFALGADQAAQDAEGTAYFDNFVIANFARLPGDYDVDGDVDANDYLVWRDTYGGTPVSGTGADGNGDGVVDAADYTVWRDNLGAQLTPSASADAAPEPSAIAVGVLALGAWARRRTG